MTAARRSRRGLVLGLLAGGVLAAALLWAFTNYFRPDLLVGFATWVRSCF
ncbi:MAG: hypothetical protein MUF80_05245 [Burkholderiales bacterium]|jgi:hypothetical protein|nr:hypothetical protein [Burkholderiales bacterium]